MTGRKSFMDEVEARIPAADFEAEYFPGGLVRVTIDLTPELVEQVMTVAKEQGWPRGEAFVALLALGIGALEEEKVRRLMERDDPPARDELEVLLRRMREMEMRYAVMKRRLWDFLKAYQAASLADGALRAEVTGLRRLAESLRAERDALRQRVAALEAAQDGRDDPPAALAGRESSASARADLPIWRRILYRLGGRA